MRMKNQIDNLIHVFLVLIISSVCVANNSQIRGSPPQSKAYTFYDEHHQNSIKGYNKPNTIFTQRNFTNHLKTENSSSAAENKQFSFFNLVSFPNEQCKVGSVDGFCVATSECTNFGGSSIGSCSLEYGTCCYKAIGCGGSSSMNVTYIQNADYPSYTSTSGTCSHSITRQDNICKLRLDFVAFELSDPYATQGADASNGQCLNDQMTVSGVASTQLRYLCGKMPPSWHFYLDVRDASSPTTFTFSLSSGVTQDRKWNIKVTQIDCDRKIPQGCGQYFTGSSGDPLYSFNYGNNGMYLYGMNYAICFRQEKGYCTHSFVDGGSSWVACPDSLAFPSSGILANTGAPPATSTDLTECNFIVTSANWPSPITTNNFSPTIIYHYTDQASLYRWLPAVAQTPGFYFTWQANAC